MSKLNPEIMVWARESMNLGIEEAARKLDLRDSSRSSAADKLGSLEAGVTEPSSSQLYRMSEKYYKPLSIFYFSKPPVSAKRGEDYRTLSGEPNPRHEAILDVLLRRLLAGQSLLRDALIDEGEEDGDEVEVLQFIGSANMQQTVQEVAAGLCDLLQFSLQQFRQQKTPDGAFRYLRGLAEAKGIFVLLKGNLGSWHTNLKPETFRGFALADDIAPFVVINDQDARSAWAFTLLCETVHLLLGQTCLSNNVLAANEIERFCNDVAAEVLLPEDDLCSFAASSAKSDFEKLAAAVSGFAAERNISSSLLVYRLERSGQITEETGRRLNDRLQEILQDAPRLRQKPGSCQARSGHYAARRYRLGDALISVVRRLLYCNLLAPTKAAVLLDVRPVRVYRMVREHAA